MPRHTHPRQRGGHSRAHIRAQRERIIARRLQRLANENLVREMSDQRTQRTSWRDPTPPPMSPLSKEQAVPILHECERRYYGQFGDIPYHNGLSRRLLDGAGHSVDMWDCCCSKCLAAEAPRTRRKRQDREEAARQLSDAPERWPKGAPAPTTRCRHPRQRLAVTPTGPWARPNAPYATLHGECADCGQRLARPAVRSLTRVQAEVEAAIASPSPPLRTLIGLFGWPAAVARWTGPSPGWMPWSDADRHAAHTYARDVFPRRP